MSYIARKNVPLGTHKLELKDILVKSNENGFTGIEMRFEGYRPVFLRHFEQNNDQMDNLMLQLNIEEFDETDPEALKPFIGKEICIKVYEGKKIDPFTGEYYHNFNFNPKLAAQF